MLACTVRSTVLKALYKQCLPLGEAIRVHQFFSMSLFAADCTVCLVLRNKVIILH